MASLQLFCETNDKILCLVYAPVAQMEEHRTFNAGVPGSSPGRRTSRFIIV